MLLCIKQVLPWWLSVCQCRRPGYYPGSERFPVEGKRNLLQSWEIHGQRSLMGYSSGDHKRAGHHLGTEQFNSVQSLSRVWLFATPWVAACQASLSITNSWSLHKLMSIQSVMPSNYLILCHPLLLPSIFPSIRVFSFKDGVDKG